MMSADDTDLQCDWEAGGPEPTEVVVCTVED